MVFVHELALNDDRRPLHDILIIHTSSGAKFVFDPTGYQFGFGDYLHEWRQYKRDWVDEDSKRELVPRDEISEFNKETNNKYRLMQAARLEEIDKVKEEIDMVNQV